MDPAYEDPWSLGHGASLSPLPYCISSHLSLGSTILNCKVYKKKKGKKRSDSLLCMVVINIKNKSVQSTLNRKNYNGTAPQFLSKDNSDEKPLYW